MKNSKLTDREKWDVEKIVGNVEINFITLLRTTITFCPNTAGRLPFLW